MSSNPIDCKGIESLEVYLDRERVGELQRTAGGARFTYDASYIKAAEERAIAFSMPVREKPYDVHGTNLHTFFAGLLPEGLRLQALERGLKTSKDDLFSLLAAGGSNTVGDVWVKCAEVDDPQDSPLVDPRKLREHSFKELLAQSLDWEKGGDSVTVAGVQPKISAGMISFPLRANSKQREYILKLSPPEYPKLVENEAFFMQVARSAGMQTATVKVVHDSEAESALLVERFDRQVQRMDAGGPLRRLHQEDACQLLDVYPAEKYRVSLKSIAEALEVCSAPLVERLGLLRLQAFSYLIANGDLHAKNVSVYKREGQTRLTPAYDLLSTLPYGDAKLALKLEGRDEDLQRAHFITFGERLGIRSAATERMLNTLVKKLSPWIPRLPEIGLEEKKSRHLARVMTKRLLDLSA
ncbi:MAG: serine/threonine-protein kinase HipA [Planctomycetota bacterium]|jgi:serine/threonine-protein kinase HipA